ncbi:class I SAM-dependent DNA methyltransferase [Peribacillus sp. SCS-155]|uniref:class I SAM-dependent DNA methyltransferase n=1 Tax=Peribacillus sedimenti TaxID=3115297 RepID=UPI003905B4FC
MKKDNIFPDNLEEYEDADLYDMENTHTKELEFLLDYASETGGTIIDLACGTGRLAIPLAKNGYRLIGVDISEEMLEQAKQKSEGLEIDWVLQDITKMDILEQSELIFMAGNSFQHFLTNESQDMLLNAVHRHLTHKGRFVFNTRFPAADELLQPAGEEYWRSYMYGGKKIDVYTISQYDPLSQIQDYTTIRKFHTDSGSQSEIRTHIALRYVFPKEMERVLESKNFHIEAVFGDWDKSLIHDKSQEMIYVVRKNHKMPPPLLEQ